MDSQFVVMVEDLVLGLTLLHGFSKVMGERLALQDLVEQLN